MKTKLRIDLLRQLTIPEDLFHGCNFQSERLPQELLVFFRHNSKEASNFGNIAQHHRFVLCFCFATEGGVQVDADVFDLHPDESILIFPYQPHHFTRFTSDEIAWLFISFEMKHSAWIEPLRSTVFSIDNDDLRLINQMAEKYITSQGEILIPQLTVLLEQLLNSTSINRATTVSKRMNAQSSGHAHLSTVLDFIHNNLGSNIKVPDVVAQSGYSETVLRDIFAKQLNTSIAAYIRKMRVLRACHLLDTSSESISAISDSCGFSSQYAFSRTFKQTMGCAPNAYRRKQR